MTGRSILKIIIHLTPTYNHNEATHLVVKLTIGGLSGGLQGGSQSNQEHEIFLFEQYDTNGAGDKENTKLENIQARDEKGPLGITVIDALTSSSGQAWKADRPLQGDIIISYDAVPVPNDMRDWEVAALRKDSGGLVGVLSSIIPHPKGKDLESSQVSVKWDLSLAPSGTRAVTSLGEGNLQKKNISINGLRNCILMVGNVSSFPPSPHAHDGTDIHGSCGTYWLGNLPDSLLAVKEFSSNMFPHLSAFFKDEQGSYRAFFRRVPLGQRGTSLTASSLIDYDEDTKTEDDWDLVRLLNSSMIATWARLDPEEDGSANSWFVQGFSHLYSIYLPFRFKQRTSDYFRATLNGYLSGYFTNPLTTLSISKLPPPSSSWHSVSALALRSCVYMIRMDCFTRRASVARKAGVARPIDEIISDISLRRQRGETVQERDWIRYLGEWIGEDVAKEHLHQMKEGVLMDLEDMKTAFDGIDAEEQRVMDMGFDRMSLENGVVSGVGRTTEAFQAGLRDGDKIIWASRLGFCDTHYKATFKMVVERDGECMDIEYWPRSEEVVKAWQSRKKA